VIALETRDLGKRYRGSWALQGCSLAIPSGRVAALLGPNGAGKTTLLRLAVGLTTPTSGNITVLDGLRPGTAGALTGIGFVAQDVPLYKNLSVGHLLRLARDLNVGWDAEQAASRTAGLGIPAGKLVGALSGGERAQLALTIALAKRPRLLILDEPLASLDPLARHDFVSALMAAVAQDGLSVIFSSHVVAELERIADYLIVLNRGRLQMAGDVDDLLASHRVLTGPAGLVGGVPARLSVVASTQAEAQVHLLCRVPGPGEPVPAGFQAHPVGLEELLLAYLRDPAAAALPGPALAASA
jgi:ABC-2 type transport system ATP-binding protein